MSTVFTKIINGEIPSYKIYEDDICYAFLDNNPETLGHTLVVPKVEVDKIYDLDEETYLHLFKIAKMLAKNMEEKLNARIIIKVIGVDVPHAHIHLVPYYGSFDAPSEEEKQKAREFEQIRDKLKI
jgi:histidine triad (HIT) family protein